MREKHCVAFWKPESLHVAVWRYAKKRKTSDPQIVTLREKDILIAAKLFYHQGVTYKKMCNKKKLLNMKDWKPDQLRKAVDRYIVVKPLIPT